MGTDGKPRRKGEKDFERQTHAVRTSEERKRWDEATSGITSVHGRPFAPDRKYTDGDVVLHKKLGLGIVLSVEDDMSGMRVLFRDGEEQLELTPEN